MANDLSARPWFVDTAAAGILYQHQVFIKFIEAVSSAGASTVGAAMADIRDRNNKSIVNSFFQTVGPGEIQTYNLENWFNGLIVAALGLNVTLRIHVK